MLPSLNPKVNYIDQGELDIYTLAVLQQSSYGFSTLLAVAGQA